MLHCKTRKWFSRSPDSQKTLQLYKPFRDSVPFFWYILVFLVKYFEPGQFRSLRQTVVFRDDFNHFNKGHFTTEVSAWGGGVRYIYTYSIPDFIPIHVVKYIWLWFYDLKQTNNINFI